MGKIGKYYIPDIAFSQSIEIVKTIYASSISSDEALATKLGHSTTNSGGFIKKLVTLRQLGLIKSGIKGIELTNLGSKIARPVGKEEKQAYKEMLSNVPLISDLNKKLGSKTPDKEGMLIALIDLTGVDRSILDKEVSKIQKIFNDAKKYISLTSEHLFSDAGCINMEIENKENDSEILEFKTGALYMRIPKNLDSIEQAEIILAAQKQALQKKHQKKS